MSDTYRRSVVREIDDRAEKAIRIHGWNMAVVSMDGTQLKQAAKQLRDLGETVRRMDDQLPISDSSSSARRELRRVRESFDRYDRGETS